ncbi:MAG: serine/threonine-protein phosphatase [Actinomycetota bacterium]|nr:serine/threonine-protein phosphatase [Actinomycetota bacterium]
MRAVFGGGDAARAWLLGSLAVVAVLAITDITLSGDVNISGAFAVAPFVAGTAASARQTLTIGLLTTLVAGVLTIYDDSAAGPATARMIAVLLASGLAPYAASRREERERRLSDMTRVAEVAQLAILAPVPPTVGPLALASVYLSASREAHVGGDLYEVVDTPWGVRTIVGDVRGKGLDAVRLAAVVLASFREKAAAVESLPDVARLMDALLRPQLGPEDFVTAVLGCFSAAGGLDLVNCGHPPPVIWGATSGALISTSTPTAPLGLDPEPVAERFELTSADRVLFYTDGLVEARAPGGGFVPLDALLVHIGDDPLNLALNNVLAELRRLARDGIQDDLAMLMVEFQGAAPPA